MINTSLLKTFLSVAETGSFSAAAQELNSVQSNITGRIRKLEEQFGQALFSRGKGGAQLTEFGRRFQAHAIDLTSRIEDATNELLDAAGQLAPLRIGSMETTAATRLPPFLINVRQKHRNAPLSLRTAPSPIVTQMVWERKIDVGFVAGPVDQSRFYNAPAFKETLVRIDSKDFDRQNALLAFKDGCYFRNKAQNWLRDLGKDDTEVIEMSSLDTILSCVEAGMGFAVVPESSVQRFSNISSLKITKIPDEHAKVQVNLIWRVDHLPTLAHKYLIELLQNS